MNYCIKIIRIEELSKDIWEHHPKEFHEIMNLLDFTLEIKNPFERKWMTSYELPTFILNRFVKINDYNQAEIELICKQIIKLCAFIDNGYDNETIKAFFQAHLKKLGS